MTNTICRACWWEPDDTNMAVAACVHCEHKAQPPLEMDDKLNKRISRMVSFNRINLNNGSPLVMK